MSLRVLVLGGDPGGLDYSAQNPPYRLTTTVDAWAKALKANWLGSNARMPDSNALASYDLVIADLIPHMLPGYLKYMEGRPARQKWVSLVEGGGEDYLEISPEMQRVLDASDLIGTINRRTTGYFEAISKAPAAWVGIPYPKEEVAAFAVPAEQRRSEVLICPRKQRQPSLQVAEALGVPMRAYFPKVSRTVSNLPVFWKHRYFARDLRSQIWQRAAISTPRLGSLEQSTADFYRESAGCRLWINLDPRTTWARFVLDAAALRVPIISTETTDHAQHLFPDTTVRDVYCTEQAIDIGRRLLNDPDFVLRVASAAYDKLEPYTAAACIKRLGEALSIDLE